MTRSKPNSFRSSEWRATEDIKVSYWGPYTSAQSAAAAISAFYRSTWDDLLWPGAISNEKAWLDAQDAMQGKVLPNCLEAVKLTFGIENITRACTHQLVRSRVGAGFGQQGGRDNNWSDFNFRVPETWRYLHSRAREEISELIRQLDAWYAHAITKGVPYQDARYMLPMGLTTNLVASYNLLALKGTLKRRLCNRMMWETNHVARLMHDLVVMTYPWAGRSLRSSCEDRGVCQSVSPMFPPACVSVIGGKAELCEDNSTLTEMMVQERAFIGYDWKEGSNGAWLEYGLVDRRRVERELEDPDVVLSMIDPDLMLAYRGDDGLWRSTDG